MRGWGKRDRGPFGLLGRKPDDDPSDAPRPGRLRRRGRGSRRQSGHNVRPDPRLRRREPDSPRRPDVAYSCTTDEPPIADVLLRDIQLDDIQRVTGTIVRPDAPVPAHHGCPGGPGRRTGPVLHDLAIERWGNYTTVFDADRNTVPAFAADGKWVGDAAKPDAINDLVAGGCHVGQPSLLDSGLDVGRRMTPGRQHRVSSSWGRDRNRGQIQAPVQSGRSSEVVSAVCCRRSLRTNAVAPATSKDAAMLPKNSGAAAMRRLTAGS